jgi:hypothetical protein
MTTTTANTKFAKLTSRKIHDGTRRFSFEVKTIRAGEDSRWPNFSGDRFESRKEALAAAGQRGWTVVKTWDEAMQLAGVYRFDGRYVAEGQQPSYMTFR